jgi:hypothetical protein
MGDEFKTGRLGLDFEVPPIEGIWAWTREGLRLFFRNLGPIAKIVLPLYLPFQIAISYIDFSGVSEDYQVFTWPAEAAMLLLYAIVVPAVTHLLVGFLRDGKAPPTRESLRWGLRQGPRVFKVQVLALLAMLGGLLLAVFPAFIVAVRYAFVDSVVCVEGDGQEHPFKRSVELARGHGWQILGLMVLSLTVVFLMAALLMIPLAFFEHWLFYLIGNLALDVALTFTVAVTLVVYLALSGSASSNDEAAE